VSDSELTSESVKGRFREAEEDMRRAAERLQSMATTLQALEGVKLELRQGLGHLRETASLVSDGTQAVQGAAQSMRRAIELIERADIVRLTAEVHDVGKAMNSATDAIRERVTTVERAQGQHASELAKVRGLVVGTLILVLVGVGVGVWGVLRG